jgi:hypothetical protein
MNTPVVFPPLNVAVAVSSRPGVTSASPKLPSQPSIQSALDTIVNAGPANRFVVEALPAFHSGRFTVKSWTQVTGWRFATQFQQSNDDFGTVRLQSNSSLINGLIEGTTPATQWAVVVEPGAGSWHLRNVDILSGEVNGEPEAPGVGRGNGVLISSGSKTGFRDHSVGDFDGVGSRAFVYMGGPIGFAGPATFETPNNDTHVRWCFDDTLMSDNANSGVYHFQDSFGGRITGCLGRAAAPGYTVKVDRTVWSTGLVDILTEHSTFEGAPGRIGAGASLLNKGSFYDSIVNDGTYLNFANDGDKVYVKPAIAAFTAFGDQTGRSVVARSHADLSYLFPGRAVATATPRISGYAQTVPAGTWRIRVCLAMDFLPQYVGSKVCVGIRNSTSGRLIALFMLSGSSVVVSDWSSPTAFSADINGPPSLFVMPDEMWVEVQDDGTNFIFRVSRSGLSYSEIGRIAKASATGMNQLWFGGDDEQIGAGTGGQPPARPISISLRSWGFV